MEYKEKLEKLETHLKEHPNDYQSVISHLKMRSDAIEHEIWLEGVKRRKNIAKYRRLLNEKRTGE